MHLEQCRSACVRHGAQRILRTETKAKHLPAQRNGAKHLTVREVRKADRLTARRESKAKHLTNKKLCNALHVTARRERAAENLKFKRGLQSKAAESKQRIKSGKQSTWRKHLRGAVHCPGAPLYTASAQAGPSWHGAPGPAAPPHCFGGPPPISANSKSSVRLLSGDSQTRRTIGKVLRRHTASVGRRRCLQPATSLSDCRQTTVRPVRL